MNPGRRRSAPTRSRFLAWPALAGSLLLAVACSGDAPAEDRDDPEQPTGPNSLEIIDSEGREVRLPGPARRIVSLVPSATLTLSAIGAQGTLVARTDHDTTRWTASLPSVGGGLQPSLEAIVAATPDLVIRFGGPQDTRTPASLDELGITHVAIRPDGITDVFESIRLIGEVTGNGPAADTLIRTLRLGLDSVRSAAAGLAPVRVAYVLGGDPPWVAGPGTYIHELVELAGGTNAFRDLGALYSAVSFEEFVARPVDVILTPRGGSLDRSRFGEARIAEVGDALELPGPGVAEAAWTVLRLLHPGGPR